VAAAASADRHIGGYPSQFSQQIQPKNATTTIQEVTNWN